MVAQRQSPDPLRRAASLLRTARHAIALTGAGLSTPSGIPDFRSPGLGLWEHADPLDVATIHAFRRNPMAFYDWVRPVIQLMLNAEPNPGHVALAQLEQAGVLQALLTQNIDGLHQKAGSSKVFELHGHLRLATCLDCFRVTPIDGVLPAMMAGQVPHCERCGGTLKPNIVLFNEQLPFDVVAGAMEQAHRADLILVTGSSLLVMPVAKIPALVRSGGGDVIVVNNEATYADDFAEVVFRGDVAEVLPRLAHAVVDGVG